MGEQRRADRTCKRLHKQIRVLEARFLEAEPKFKVAVECAEVQFGENKARVLLFEKNIAERHALNLELQERVQHLLRELKRVCKGAGPRGHQQPTSRGGKRVQRAKAAATRHARAPADKGLQFGGEQANWASASSTPESCTKEVKSNSFQVLSEYIDRTCRNLEILM